MNVVTHMKPESKRQIRILLDAIIEDRKKELAIFERNITEPIRKSIKITMEARQGRIPIELMLQRNKEISQHIEKFLDARPKGEKY